MVDALARSFVPGPPPRLPDYELGLVYEPAGHELGGGDIFGAWTLPDGRVAVLVGDLGGKGLEAAAQCAMVRFFIEARSWDCDRPAEVLAQTSAALRRREADECSVPVFLAILGGRRIRYCNAGHPSPRVLQADGGEHELTATGLPLGAREDGHYTDAELPFAAGDVLFAATDGLVDARRGDERFGDERLPQLLAAYAREVDPEELVQLVHRDAERWVEELHDDIVILGLRR
jgi:serine phosphatase RsbU (regulator of sigma subunit)